MVNGGQRFEEEEEETRESVYSWLPVTLPIDCHCSALPVVHVGTVVALGGCCVASVATVAKLGISLLVRRQSRSTLPPVLLTLPQTWLTGEPAAAAFPGVPKQKHRSSSAGTRTSFEGTLFASSVS